MAALARIVLAVEAGLRVFAAACLGLMALLVVAQVVLRYGGGSVPAFTEEVARYAMIWMALMAAAVAVSEGSHIRIDLVPALLARRPAAAAALATMLEVVALTVFLVLLWQGIDMVAFAHGQRSDGLRLRLSYPYAAVPVALAFTSLFAAARMAAARRRP
jgi:TRAP-type C4-dicarboxylate transport system, small permease component